MTTYVAPWTETWRPQCITDLALSPENRTQLEAIVETGVFPNLMLHGPPGTGKTSTLMALIRAYRSKWGAGPMLSLNAGDDRGTKVVRGLLTDFVGSADKVGIHIVVMDEVDYMTDLAQSAISALIHRHQHRVVFCFICNYLPRIGERLRRRCTLMRFGQLPADFMDSYLKQIAKGEHVRLTTPQLDSLRYRYRNDVRGMVNELQRRTTIWDIRKMVATGVSRPLTWWRQQARRCEIDLVSLLMMAVRHIIRSGHHQPELVSWAWEQSQLADPSAEELLHKLKSFVASSVSANNGSNDGNDGVFNNDGLINRSFMGDTLVAETLDMAEM
jgi:hypothetical protein